MLEDEINRFSNRRTQKSHNSYASKRDDAYDDDDIYDEAWDDEDASDNDVLGLNFKMYRLNGLVALNAEIEANEVLVVPFWKVYRYYFKKGTLTKVGVILMKIEKLLASDNFEDVKISNTKESVEALQRFAGHLYTMHKRRIVSNMVTIVVFLLFESWTGWTTFWAFMIGWYVVDIVVSQFKYKRKKAWVERARVYLYTQEESEVETSRDLGSKEDDVMAFNRYMTQHEQESWSVRLYDTIANLFKK